MAFATFGRKPLLRLRPKIAMPNVLNIYQHWAKSFNGNYLMKNWYFFPNILLKNYTGEKVFGFFCRNYQILEQT